MYEKTFFESVNTRSISKRTLDRIFEIEQDMWSRGIGEYVACSNCKKIYSKDDIYGIRGNISLPKELRNETVMKIEKYLGYMPDCSSCNIPTKHIYDLDYISEIAHRYTERESMLSLARSGTGKIIGFMDGYIATLQEIYDLEFSFHFTDEIIDTLCEKYHLYRDTRLLTVSSIGTDDQNKSLLTTLGLIRNFFDSIDERNAKTPTICESIIASSTYCIFMIMGAEKTQMSEDSGLVIPSSSNAHFTTDILFQSDAIQKYKKCFNIRARDVLKFSKNIKIQTMRA